jgi:Transposase DDE domain
LPKILRYFDAHYKKGSGMIKTKATDLLKVIPNEILDKIGEETCVDKVNQQLTGKTIFNALLLSLAQSTRVSLRILERVYNSATFELFNQENSKKKAKGTHSSFADRLSKINAEYFAQIFQYLVDTYHKKMPSDMHHNIYRFDGTLMGISTKLFKGIDCGGGENRTFSKIIVGHKGLIPSSIYFCKTTSESADDIAIINAIKEASVKPDDIITFDRGLRSAKTFMSFTDSGVMFVTRVNVGRVHNVLCDNPSPTNSPEKNILSDQTVVLWHAKREKFFSMPFRLIKTMSSDNSEIWILTNIFTLDASDIADIYKRRWDIEVLFRFIKQELNLKHFLARNHNGLKVYMYMILIMAILLLMYKKVNSLTGFKLVKMDFFKDIENDIICDLIKIAGGNPAIFLERFAT